MLKEGRNGVTERAAEMERDGYPVSVELWRALLRFLPTITSRFRTTRLAKRPTLRAQAGLATATKRS